MKYFYQIFTLLLLTKQATQKYTSIYFKQKITTWNDQDGTSTVYVQHDK